MEHIMGLKHQMAFLKEHDKEKYSLVDSSALSKSYLEPIVQDLISKYEIEHGRGKMSVKKEKGKSGKIVTELVFPTL
ncbi:hypothetical protein AVEN_53265-1 [Araneus ventricosus]|uniref:Uncharacterized protein n=1 Tax=Araneus ventricosus TaxID=182803 RepID=A0A4Y2A9N3_ARAVE|nr:hypothetical protein AVEN_53265-1 [Araneus ventricosus]